ncbi:MAG TPA: nuclear transport factor 2 family protein [Pyrinomonadaceae bacterium]|nr:nuclear transport factor 2 family protein [Pyrinomonadaceae bacterium]
MKRIAASAILLLLMSCGVFAQTAPDAAELTKLLNDFLAGASRNDPAVHESFWADDLIYTRSAGRRVSKADILRDLRSAPAPKPTDPKTVYTAEDIRIQQYGDTAIVAFRLVATTDTGGAKYVANLLNSGTFVKRDGKWQVVNWQSTRMPRTEEESKRELAEFDAAFHEALATADLNKLTALTDPAFVALIGTNQMKIQQLADNVRLHGLRYVKPDLAKSTISVFGETAVVRGEGPSPNKTRYSITYINQLGTWKAIAMHTSAAP